MKKYRVIAPYVSFSSGEIEIEESQYRARLHALKPLGNGRYLIIEKTGFKKGEVIGYGGEVNKVLLFDISPVEDIVPPPSQPVETAPAPPLEEVQPPADTPMVETAGSDPEVSAPEAGPEVAEKLLDGRVDDIREALPGLVDEALFRLMDEEGKGKNRKGVIEAIEKELDNRGYGNS